MSRAFKVGHIHLLYRTLYVIPKHVLLNMDYVNLTRFYFSS
jgi:hypothetical protein